ncbi:TPR-like protein [Piromyces finnis]|uniref:Pre-mRNA-splicing factor SYF1 n=1 Tax=Piromyces finnis TaxID=1754191 RepID=A0A1Y1V6Z9_9FUNG|nr:TPR-like protein [Piromyces finnis]|eukprot:ORX48364.1 TPR-like protein [Piromyces finnis]
MQLKEHNNLKIKQEQHRINEIKKQLKLIKPDDIPFEEDLIRNPFNLKKWLRYIEFKEEDSFESKVFIYERALKELPGSYKIWKKYLDLRVSVLLEKSESVNKKKEREGYQDRTPKVSLLNEEWERVNNCFERSLILLNKMPVIWASYCGFLMFQQKPTRTRRTFDRALKALPITQHSRIWELYKQFANKIGGETAIRVWRRYLKLDAGNTEDYIQLLLSMNPPKYTEAVKMLSGIVENPKFISKYGKSPYQLWIELCELLCDHADELETVGLNSNILILNSNGMTSGTNNKIGMVEQLDVEKIIRSGIARFSDQVGILWNSLARWWILKQEFEKARDIYEEAMTKVNTVKDFTYIFDAYSQFEEKIISMKMEQLNEEEDDDENDEDDEEENEDEIELDLLMARFENLMDRRPFLVNDVLLRQNPNNVHEWEKRVELWKKSNNQNKVLQTYTNGIKTIDPKKASGKLSSLWISFAHWYLEADDINSARTIFEKATKVPFKKVDELAEVWCEWSDVELEIGNVERALDVMARAVSPPNYKKLSVRYTDESETPQARLFKSLKLWAHYIDLEEALGTAENTRAVYDRMMELKIATPQIIINYAIWLEDQKCFEESFKIYERGIDQFGYPVAYEIWNIYLTKFIKRYQGTKLERTRDLFEQAIDKCPEKFAKSIYLMFAKVEEDYGLTRHAMRIYDRATQAVSDEDRLEVFKLYIAKVKSYYGVTATREIYQRAIEILPNVEAKEMALEFVELETQLGEIDRARAILSYGTQFADPRADAHYWKVWHDFEVKYGNEDTFKEMLRIKRSVQAKFNTEVHYISAQMMAAKANNASSSTESVEPVPESGNAMERLEQNVLGESSKTTNFAFGKQFVKATITQTKPSEDDMAAQQKSEAVANPDEIEIDMDDDDDDDDNSGGESNDEGNIALEQKTVPDAVFGSIKDKAASSSSPLKRKR